MICVKWLDSWMTYYSFVMVANPLQAQLAVLVYEKSLRRKNVKLAEELQIKESTVVDEADGLEGPRLINTTTAADTSAPLGSSDNTNGIIGDTAHKDGAPPATEERSSVLKSRQAIVNLVGDDGRRISNFAAYQFIMINSIGELFVYSIFLIQLIGWLPFIAGIIVWALTLPVNTHFSKQYIRLTEDLMSFKDKKVAVLNEALLGIRQIKFAALERQWEKRIMDLRNEELQRTWKIFLADTVLFSCWIISPIFLAAASLAVYSVLNENLSASIAFTALSIFKSLEAVLGALPDMLATAFDTVVSTRRIETYLKGPEMKKILTDGNDITFENVSIAWPVDGDNVRDEDRFILGGLNFTFPRGELSVISGKTGTGKSLILSALIGEADILEGKIMMPAAPTAFDRHDLRAHPGDWILPGAIAFVAQTPWLEGASLRDNILFGLPLIGSRYEEVIQACALKKDLEILADGDKTELGANGINLSGGQKWRVSLARAIYSRAEILILDDIFSAVDAHVGRQIFNRCIGGDICRGRTRILVTHHVGLVGPMTKFFLELGDGRVLRAGLTSSSDEQEAVRLVSANEREAGRVETKEAAVSPTAVNLETASLVDAQEGTDIVSNDPLHGGTISTFQKTQKTQDPKKFVQDETRQRGMVKMRIYTSYMKDCGGWPFWTVCAILFAGFETSNLLRA